MSKYCPFVHDSIHFTTDGKVANCCLQDTRGFPTVIDVDFNNLNTWYFNHPFLKKIREDLYAGIEHASCETCWKKERNGYASKRTIFLKERNKKHDKNEVLIQKIDYRISNKCNLQCKMCWPGASDQIANLAKELDTKNIKHLHFIPPEVPDYGNKVTKELLENNNLTEISFAGGEPFIMPEVEELLIKLAERNKLDIKIRILTNVTTIKTSVLNALEKFNNVTIMASIDGVGEEIEYQRYPASWKTISKNFDRLYNSKISRINLTPCISFLNYRTIPEFFEWAEQYPKSHIAFNLVENEGKSYINYRYIPMQSRTNTIEKFKNYKFKNPVHQGWKFFQQKGMYEYVEPSQEACDNLLLQSKNAWDYKCKVKFLDAYPWATYMLDRAKTA